MLSTPRLIPALLAAAALLAPAPAAHAAPTSALIDRSLERGDITKGEATLYRLQAITEADALPPALRGDTLEDGTMLILQAQRDVGDIKSPALRREVESRLEPQPRAAGTTCHDSTVSLPGEYDTTHFRLEYDPSDLSGLTIQQYGAALEHAWDRHITEFDWAPPVIKATPDTGNRLVVRLDPALASGGILGYVSNGGTHAGLVGDNPATSWDDKDAYAGCMVLRPSYTGVGGEAQMSATAHHEFHHLVQYGMGAPFGSPSAEANFVEGGAKWIEDELVDDANAVHGYFHTDPRFPMGEYQPWPYTYWAVFRAMTERYGTAVDGGAEDVMQRFWERVSQGDEQLDAMRAAIAAEGTTLAAAFHDASVMARFITPCSGLYAPPLCFEEGAAILARLASPVPRARVGDVPLSIDSVLATEPYGKVYDNYATRTISLPGGSTPYRVSFGNPGPSSDYRATVACDTGTALRRVPLGGQLAPGHASTAMVDPTGCPEVVAIVSNGHFTDGDPDPGDASIAYSAFKLATGTAAGGVLSVARSGSGSVASAPSGIACGTDCSEWFTPGTQVTLTAAPAAGRRFDGWAGACSGTATTCVVDVADAAAVTATFSDPPPPDPEPKQDPGVPPGGPPQQPGAPGDVPLTGADVVATPDRLAPAFTRLSAPGAKVAAFLRGGVRVALALSEPAGLTATLTVDRATARRLKLGTRRVIGRGTAAPGASAIVLRAEPAAARKLRRSRRPVRGTLAVVATDAAGNATTRTLSVTLKR